MIHRVYICANLNSPFVVQHCDHIEDCNINNLVLPGASNFSLMSQVQSKEGEHMFLVSTNLLQDSIDKDCVPYDRGAYKFAGIHTNWTHGHVSSWSFSPHYFGNLVCFRVVQNHFQAHSTPRTAFLQEEEDDEDMSSVGTTTIGEWHRDPRDQHGYPNRDGGPKLIRFESPRWRPKETQVRVHLGVQEQPAPKLTPRSHTEFVLDVLYMDGKIISRSFQWHRSQAQIHPESTGIVETR